MVSDSWDIFFLDWHVILDRMNEDEFTDYLIQLTIEESCHEAFAISKNGYVCST